MDPRHPEKAVSRIKELYDQFVTVLDRIELSTTNAQMAELEREGTFVTQEMYFVVPRLHDALIQASRLHRQVMSRRPVEAPKMETPAKSVEKPVEKPESASEEAKVVESKTQPEAKKKPAQKKGVSKKGNNH